MLPSLTSLHAEIEISLLGIDLLKATEVLNVCEVVEVQVPLGALWSGEIVPDVHGTLTYEGSVNRICKLAGPAVECETGTLFGSFSLGAAKAGIKESLAVVIEE